jgi:glycosyltransferase involved in cell wall biosynthesis
MPLRRNRPDFPGKSIKGIMDNKSLVSVVIPTYNRIYCLPETIRSVFAQTHQNFEILVIDDGSTDATRETLGQLWPHEPRLRYIHQDNGGLSAARNRGIDAARGNFVAMLDSDDTWVPWKLEAQLACLERFPQAVMVHSEMAAVDADGRIFDEQYLRRCYEGYQRYPLAEIYPESTRVMDFMPNAPQALRETWAWCGDIFSHALTGNLVHSSTLMVRRGPDGMLERYESWMRAEEAFGFHLIVAERGPVAFLDAATMHYRRGRNDHLWNPDVGYPAPIAHKYNQRFLELVEPRIRAGGPRMRVSPAALKDTLANAHAWLAESARALGSDAQMLGHLLLSLRYKPWQPRLIARLLRNRLFNRRAVKARVPIL